MPRWLNSLLGVFGHLRVFLPCYRETRGRRENVLYETDERDNKSKWVSDGGKNEMEEFNKNSIDVYG